MTGSRRRGDRRCLGLHSGRDANPFTGDEVPADAQEQGVSRVSWAPGPLRQLHDLIALAAA
jgi:hypothetical protein